MFGGNPKGQALSQYERITLKECLPLKFTGIGIFHKFDETVVCLAKKFRTSHGHIPYLILRRPPRYHKVENALADLASCTACSTKDRQVGISWG